MKKLTKKLLYYVIGSAILSLGISLSILSRLGAGAFDALNNNFSHLINTSVGNAMYISIFILYIIIMILKPRKIYIIGYLLSMVVGFGIDTWLQILPTVDFSILFKVLYYLSSLICLPLGITFIIKSQLPLSPMDNLLIILVEKKKWSVALTKTLIEGSFAMIALIYGLLAQIGVGALSVGTIIITLGIGPGIQFFMKYIKDV